VRITTRVRIAVAVALAAGALMAVPSGASAGVAGQQLWFHDGIGNVFKICVSGQSGNGFTWQSGCWKTPTADAVTWSWWWIDTVYIDEYDGNGRYIRTQTTNVPIVSPYNCWEFENNTGKSYIKSC
jgi:hypothetical protein